MFDLATTTEHFLIAAKKAEIRSLDYLLSSCQLVQSTTELIHELQKERGLSNSFLVSSGERFASELQAERTQTDAVLAGFLQHIRALDIERSDSFSSNVYSRIASSLHLLEALPAIRDKVDRFEVQVDANTDYYSRLMESYLAIIFETADLSTDPDITRLLVALFNLVQGKEYAGLERAWGLIGFTAGHFSTLEQERIQTFQEHQARCFGIFADVSSVKLAKAWREVECSNATQELVRLRVLIERALLKEALPSSMSEVWFATTTARIDATRQVEILVMEELLSVCCEKQRLAQQELQRHMGCLQSLSLHSETLSPRPSATFSFSIESEQDISNFAKATTLYELVNNQAKRIKAVSDELAKAKRTLEERKVIERAKGVIMVSQKVSEEVAYQQLRKAAMNKSKRLIDIAENVISVYDMVSAPSK
ncbi:nitrate regulatory protein [Maribrevibacterium harenarium]|nr:nitrate regulatory protein [Maribrevibacterium harenarium]